MKKIIVLLLVFISFSFSEVFKCELFPHYKDKTYAVFAYTLEAAYIDGVLRGKITNGEYTKECWNEIDSEVHLTAETRGVVISEFTAHGKGYTDPLEYNPRSKRPYTHWYITDTFYWTLLANSKPKEEHKEAPVEAKEENRSEVKKTGFISKLSMLFSSRGDDE